MVKRLTFVISSLGAGGAERVASMMINHWAARSREVTLVTLSGTEDDFFSVDSRVQRIALGEMGKSRSLIQGVARNFLRVARLRTAIRRSRPDAVISFVVRTNVLALLASLGLNIPVIISERVDPARHRIGKIWNWLRGRTYPCADALVVQSPAVLQWVTRNLELRSVAVIPNPVVPSLRDDGAPAYFGRPLLVALGRLEPQKGFDILMRAFALVAPEQPDWTLAILGEGPSRGALEALRNELRLQSRIHMPGRVRDPVAVLHQADLFVLSSRYEGFPNALCEAMACGLAVVSFDCPSGPRDIIRHGLDGILVPPEDVDALADALRGLMVDSGKRRALGAQAVEVTERFAIDRVMAMWDQLVENTRIGRGVP